MAFRTIAVRFSTNAPAYSAQLAQAAKATRDFAGINKTLITSNAEVAGSMGRLALAGGAVLAGAFIASGAAAVGFESRMRNVATISKDVRQNFEEVSKELIGMTRELPQTANQLAEGLYDVASSGFAGRDGLLVLEQAAIGASAGLSTTAVAAKGLTAVLNAYGLAATGAADVNDIMFQTVNLGVLTFEELASNLGDFVGLAAVMKVPFDEAAASLATMTRVGISAAESSTSLNRIFQSLLDPSDALAAKLKMLGYESGQAAVDAEGFNGIMQILGEEVGYNAAEMQALFPEFRALRGALALTADSGRVAAEVFAGITDESARAQAAQLALAKQAKSTGYQLKIAANGIMELALGIGNALLPVIRPLASFVSTLSMGFKELPGPVRMIVGAFAALATVALLVAGAFLMFGPRIMAARAALAAMTIAGTAASTVLGGLALKIGLVGGAIGIAVTLWSLWNAKKAKAKEIAADLATAMQQEADGVENSTDAWIVNRLAKTEALTEAERLGVKTRDLVRYVRGEKGLRLVSDKDLFQGTKMFDGLQKVRGEFEKASPAAKALVDAQSDVNATMEKTVPVSAAARAEVAKYGVALGTTASSADELTDAQKELAKGLNSFLDTSAAMSAAADKTTGFVTAAGALSAATSEAQEAAKAKAEAAAESYNANIDASTEATQKAAKERAEAIKESAEDQARAIKNAARDGTDAAKDAAREQAEAVTDSARKQAEAIVDAASTTADANRKKRRTADDYPGAGPVGLGAVADRMRADADRQTRWIKELADLTRRYGTDVTDALRDMGEEGVDLVHQMATGTGPAVDEVARQLGRLAPAARKSLDAFIAEMTTQLDERMAFEANLATLARRGLVAIATEFARLGPTAAGLASEAVERTDEALAPLEQVMAARAQVATDGYASTFDLALAILPRIAERQGRTTVDALAKELNVAPSKVREAMGLVRNEIEAIKPGLEFQIRIGFDVSEFANLHPALAAATGNILAGQGGSPVVAKPIVAPTTSTSNWTSPWARRHGGGNVPGRGDVPILAEGGEFVVRKEAVSALGMGTMTAINSFHQGGPVGHRHRRGYSERIATLQASLKAAGYDPGPIDGIYGPRTARAAAASARGARPATPARAAQTPYAQLNPNRRDPFAMGGGRPPNPHFAGEVANTGLTAAEAARYGYRPVDYSGYRPAYDRYPTITLRSGAVVQSLRPGGRDPFVRSYDTGGMLPPGVTMAYNGTGRPERVVSGNQDSALLSEVRGLREALSSLKLEVNQNNTFNGSEMPTEASLDYASRQLGFRAAAAGRV